MGKIKSNLLKIGILILVITALVMGTALPALADSTTTATPTTTAGPALHTVQGKVISIATSSFVVQNGTQAPVTINVDSNTKYYEIPLGKAQADINNTVAQDNKKAQKAGKPQPTRASDLRNAHIPANWRDNLGWLSTFDTGTQLSDIQVGDRIIARTTNDGNNLTKQIMLIKAPVIQQVKGTISGVTSNSITIQPATGNAITLTLDGNTRVSMKGLFLAENGDYAVATYNHTTMVAQLVNIQATAPTATPARTLSSIAITPAVPANLAIGSTQQFTATATYSNNTTANITSQVTWASSVTTMATITSPGGLAAGVAAGTTNITASLSGITSPAVTLTVTTGT